MKTRPQVVQLGNVTAAVTNTRKLIPDPAWLADDIIVLAMDWGSTPAMTLPGGWAWAGTDPDTQSTLQFGLLVHKYTSAERALHVANPSTYGWDFNLTGGSSLYAGVGAAIPGINLTAGVDGYIGQGTANKASSSATVLPLPTMSSVGLGEVLLLGLASYRDSVSASPTNNLVFSAGITELGQAIHYDGTAASHGIVLGEYDGAPLAEGTIGGGTATSTPSSISVYANNVYAFKLADPTPPAGDCGPIIRRWVGGSGGGWVPAP